MVQKYLISTTKQRYRSWQQNKLSDEKQLVIKARVHGNWGFWDNKGNILLAPGNDEAETFFRNHLFLVKKEGKRFVINASGKVYE